MPKALAALLLLAAPLHAAAPQRPNVVLLYADDLGYGDPGCYGGRAIPTPNLDRLAREGLRFTDGHAAAATCTPSRYSLLTGEYAFRQKGTGVLPGNANLVIRPGRTTLPEVLRRAGYRTAVVGKWHLGLGDGPIDWNADIKPGPQDVGFDESFIMPATNDRTPCVYVDGRRVVGLDPNDPITVSYGPPIPGVPTGKDRPDLLRVRASHGHDQTIVNGVGRIGFMKGGTAALWKDEDMTEVFTSRAVKFLEANASRPFFLYLAFAEPHVPRLPHPRFAGKTALGPRGDVIAQMDAAVGEVLKTLDRLGRANDTLVLFTSDNGPVLDDGYHDDAVKKLGDHKPAGPFRGGKYSAFEAGTRVPWLVRWPARVKPGVTDALVSQVDLTATLAALAGQKLAPGDAPDSANVLPALLGEARQGRDHLVEQAGVLALREGPWKYIEPGKGPRASKTTGAELGNDPAGQLYHLADDPGERRDRVADHPDRVKAMRERLRTIRQSGRTPGGPGQ